MATGYQDNVVLVTIWHNVLISIWRDSPSLHHLEALRAVQNGLPGRHAVLSVITELKKARMPEDARKAASDITAKAAPRVLGTAQVLEATGFAGAIARSLLTGINLADRVPYPRKVFDGTDEACQWLAPLAGHPDVTGEALINAVQGLRLAWLESVA